MDNKLKSACSNIPETTPEIQALDSNCIIARWLVRRHVLAATCFPGNPFSRWGMCDRSCPGPCLHFWKNTFIRTVRECCDRPCGKCHFRWHLSAQFRQLCLEWAGRPTCPLCWKWLCALCWEYHYCNWGECKEEMPLEEEWILEWPYRCGRCGCSVVRLGADMASMTVEEQIK